MEEVVEIEVDAMLLFVRTYRLPVIYVFGQKPIDVDHCVAQLVHILDSLPTENVSTKERTVLLRHDVAYSHRAGELLGFHNEGRLSDSAYIPIDDIIGKLRATLEPLKIPVLYAKVTLRVDPPSFVEHPGQNSSLPNRDAAAANKSEEGDCTILYIGEESLGLTNLLMTHASSEVTTYICFLLTVHL